MGVIDAVNDVYFAVTRPFDRLTTARFGTKLIRTGIEATARVEGIRTTHSEATSNQWVWIFAVTVNPGAADSFRAGFKQSLNGPRDRIHLGSEVLVRHDERRRRVVIDWPTMRRRWGIDTPWDTPDGWRPVRDLPPIGIDDHSQKPPKGAPFTALITAVGFSPTPFGGVDVRPDIALRLPDGRDLVGRRVEVPEYAFYLLAPGNSLPVGVDGDKVRFDWVAAANDAVRNAPRATFDYANDPRRRRQEPSEVVSSAPPAAAAPVPIELDPIHGVTFDTWVAVEVHLQQDPVAPAEYDAVAARYGVAPGRWAAAQAAWHARMASDWRLGQRFGQAFEDERKARRKRG
jgi:hypothetical protein